MSFRLRAYFPFKEFRDQSLYDVNREQIGLKHSNATIKKGI